jgi:hypothetical protein
VPPVGGIIIPIDKISSISPWMIAAPLIALIVVSLAVWNRRQAAKRSLGS